MAAPKETIIYVTREIERATGTTPGEHYLIVANRTRYAEKVRNGSPEGAVILVDDPENGQLGTSELLKHPATAELVAKKTTPSGKPYIMVFKNTARIEPLAREHSWTLLNPPAATSEKIENKVSQVSWLAELERYLPPHRLQFMKSVTWPGKPFILQWAHGHTGTGTILVDTEAKLAKIKARFPERRTRITEYVRGPSFTLNVVVSPEKILLGSLSYQITGLAPFTTGAFATVGNDWGAARTILSQAERDSITNVAMEIGARMQKEFWRGLFGIDLIKDAGNGRLYLIEINARQPASATFESALQGARRAEGAKGLTTFEAHIETLLGHPLNEPLIEITDGAQIVQRVTKDRKSYSEDVIGSLELAGYEVVGYENTREGEDLIRIQSKKSLMRGHDELNEDGRKVAEILQG